VSHDHSNREHRMIHTGITQKSSPLTLVPGANPCTSCAPEYHAPNPHCTYNYTGPYRPGVVGFPVHQYDLGMPVGSNPIDTADSRILMCQYPHQCNNTSKSMSSVQYQLPPAKPPPPEMSHARHQVADKDAFRLLCAAAR